MQQKRAGIDWYREYIAIRTASTHFTNQDRNNIPSPQGTTLLALIDKYDLWTWLYEALLEVSITKITVWVRVCADDCAAESAIKASNE